MSTPLRLAKYSLGVGDRFAHQGRAQLEACRLAARAGVEVIPVWNKSNREHLIIGTDPADTRAAADAAVRALGWTRPYHVDADHIRLETVDRFLPHADFFTIDVAESIGRPAEPAAIARWIDRHQELTGRIDIAGIPTPFATTRAELERIAAKYLLAAQDAGRIYRHLEARKGETPFITEVSMDETDLPQTPLELLAILAALADEGVPLQTIAPKFTGRFNKGVDYVGDVAQFEIEFNADLAVIRHAVQAYGLPDSLKLSVHSGSDKFSIYGPIHQALGRFEAGLHLKTAGTTWLEEVIGLAETGGDCLAVAKDLYAGALEHITELCAPYATVIDIQRRNLPYPASVNAWSAAQFAAALRHDRTNPEYNPHFRQLLHVGFRMAARMGKRYLQALETAEAAVARNVTANLYERHLRPVFLG